MSGKSTTKVERSATWMKGRQVLPPNVAPRRSGVIAVVIAVVMTLGFAGLIVRVAFLQIQPSARIAEQARQHTSSAVLQGRRGALLDRRGRPLAVTREARTLFVDPQMIKDRGAFSTQVYHELGYDPAKLEMALAARPDSRYVVIDPVMPDEVARKYQNSPPIPGLATHAVTIRAYPYHALAGQVIGFVGKEGKGLDGLEMTMQKRLEATSGRMAFTRDHGRRPLWVEPANYQPPRDGEGVRLSIDLTLQAIAERQLQATVQKFHAQAGQIVVMDPHTGEILAMANYPAFAPDDPRPAGDEPSRRNRAVTDVFEPGSIFKPVVWASLTEMKAASPTEKIDTTTAGYYRFDFGRTLRDAHACGLIDWDTVLIKSSNIGMARVAMRVTPQQLHDAVARFGFGSPTHAGLPGEVGGLVTRLSKWTQYSQTSVPMGQEVGVTGLQMVRAFSVFANGGLLVMPTIEAIDPRDPIRTPVSSRIIRADVAEHTREVLRRVVTEGTGRKADSSLYPLFGKTGTAQVPDLKHGGYLENQYVSSFVAGAPTDHPRLVVGCFIHRPDKSIGHYGGIVAAPAVQAVVEQSLMYLGVPVDANAKPEDIAAATQRLVYGDAGDDAITAADVAE